MTSLLPVLYIKIKANENLKFLELLPLRIVSILILLLTKNFVKGGLWINTPFLYNF